MGFKLGIVEWSYPAMGPSAFKILAELGLEGVALDFGEFYHYGMQLNNPRVQDAYLEEAAKYGLTLTSLALNAFNHISLTDELDSRDTLIAHEIIRTGMETAAKMKIPVVQLPSFNASVITSEEDFFHTVENMRYACEVSKGTGVLVASENVLSPEETHRMVRAVGNERFRIMYDSQNYFANKGYDQAQVLEEIQEYVAQVHVKDGYNQAISSSFLGQGNSGFRETAEMIRKTNCTEWILLENYFRNKPLSLLAEDVFELIKKDIEIAKEAFAM